MYIARVYSSNCLLFHRFCVIVTKRKKKKTWESRLNFLKTRFPPIFKIEKKKKNPCGDFLKETILTVTISGLLFLSTHQTCDVLFVSFFVLQTHFKKVKLLSSALSLWNNKKRVARQSSRCCDLFVSR